MHTTLDEETISYILNLNKIEFLFTQADLIRKLNKLRPTIQTTSRLINLSSPFVEQLTEAEAQDTKFEIYEYDQLIKEGQTLPNASFNNNLEFSTSDIAVVMFTSGAFELQQLLFFLLVYG